MVVLPNADHCIEVNLFGLNQTTKWQNKLHVQYTGALMTDSTLLFTLNNDFATSWGANIAPLCNTAVSLTRIRSIDLSSRTAPIADSTLGTPQAGTRAGTQMTVQNALTSSWGINYRYRGGHPRTYHPGGVLTDVSSGHLWTTTFITAAQNAFNSWLNAINAFALGSDTIKLIMLSYYSGSHKVPGQPPPPPVLRPTPVPYLVNSVVVHPRIDTQRRRLGKELP